MSTKNNPGKYDPYPALEPDKQYFCLTADDALFEFMVHTWAMARRVQIRLGIRKDTMEERDQIAEAFRTATEGRIQYEAKALRELHKRYTFDQDGNAASLDGIEIERGKPGS